jgi:hypothetical protein
MALQFMKDRKGGTTFSFNEHPPPERVRIRRRIAENSAAKDGAFTPPSTLWPTARGMSASAGRHLGVSFPGADSPRSNHQHYEVRTSRSAP